MGQYPWFYHGKLHSTVSTAVNTVNVIDPRPCIHILLLLQYQKKDEKCSIICSIHNYVCLGVGIDLALIVIISPIQLNT